MTIVRPNGMKSPRIGLIDRDRLRAAKRSTIRFVPLDSDYPGVRAKSGNSGRVTPAFKARVASLIDENAELLRRLAL